MSMNDTYQPINCDDYDNLELACQHHLVLTLALKDKIASFSHPEIGTVVVSES